jgi:two-component system, chemotaxis family, sensor kinase CheA
MKGPDLSQVFLDEAAERLDEMDAALVAVESGRAGAETIDALFRHAHSLKGTAGFVDRDDVGMLAHAIEDVLEPVRSAGVFPPGLAGVLLTAVSALRSQVTAGGQVPPGLLSELARARDEQAKGQDQEAPASGPPADGGQPSGNGPSPPAPGQVPAEAHLLRVPASKIDHLIDVVAEVMQARIRTAEPPASADVARQTADADVPDDRQAAARMLDELRDTAVGLRTLPLATICGAMPRVVRDLAAATGKDVDFVLCGGDTELDRVVLETLSEPLAHLLRNAVTHGVETPAEREGAGKPRRGRIELRALPRGSIVEVAVADDGRGVSAATAAQAGSAGSLTDLLTRPGYSTAGEVSDTAGRGVGLDAVREHVRSFGGSLEIRSEPGRGTEVTLLLPLALSLMDVLIVERGAALFAVPLPAVTEVVTATGAASLQGQRMLTVRDRPLPLADLASLIGAAAPPLPERPPALVIKTAERTIAVACDVLAGQQEIAVKPLGPLLAGAGAFLGAAVLGDGRIALLIDPHALVTSGNRDGGGLTGGTDAGRPAAPTILVAEDSFTARELQRTILETAGYQVLTARDGRDALDVLGREPEVALVVSDLDMPRVGGLELTRAIREDPARSSLPVIIVTAHGSQDDVRRGIEAGADAYMAKRSFDQHALLATVERLVGR